MLLENDTACQILSGVLFLKLKVRKLHSAIGICGNLVDGALIILRYSSGLDVLLTSPQDDQQRPSCNSIVSMPALLRSR